MRAGVVVPLFLVSIASAQSAFASGNTLPRATSQSIAMTDANVALASDPAAQFINPANLVDSETAVALWDAGIALGRVPGRFTRPAPASGSPAGEFEVKTSHPVIPYAAFSYRYTDRLTVGFAFDSPHGLGIEWKPGTWSVDLSAFGFAPADIARKAELRTLRVGPAAAYRINDRWSIGGRAFSQYVRALDDNDIYKARANGTSVGAQIGVHYRGDGFAFGSAYTTRTKTEIDGTLSDLHPIAVASGVVAGDAKANISLPSRLQTGSAFRLLPDFWWEIDLDWIGWSYVDELTIVQANGMIVNPLTNQLHYKNTISPRTGVRWRYSPGLTLYAGLAYEPSPVPERDTSPIANIFKKMRYGIGARYKLANRIRLDVAFQLVRGLKRRVSESNRDAFGTLGDTNLFEGTYQSTNQIVGVNLSGSF